MKRKHLGYLFATLIVVISIIYGDERELFQFIISMSWLVFEVVNFITFRKKIQKVQLIKIKSNEWLSSILFSAGMVFIFSFEPLVFMNKVAISLLAIATILRVLSVYRKSYQVTNEGIFDFFYDREIINPENITDIRLTDIEISIDTNKYQNDLQIKKSELREPSWNELTVIFNQYKSKWGL